MVIGSSKAYSFDFELLLAVRVEEWDEQPALILTK
jgi:hypothetical protein